MDYGWILGIKEKNVFVPQSSSHGGFAKHDFSEN